MKAAFTPPSCRLYPPSIPGTHAHVYTLQQAVANGSGESRSLFLPILDCTSQSRAYIHHAHNAEGILPELTCCRHEKREETVCRLLYDLRKVDEAVSIAQF